jgi:hypothetical protein
MGRFKQLQKTARGEGFFDNFMHGILELKDDGAIGRITSQVFFDRDTS